MEKGWQQAQSNPRTRPGWIYSRGASKDSCSSMYKVYINVTHMKRKDRDVVCCLCNLLFMFDFIHCPCLTIYFFYDWYFVSMPDCLFFCRLKINHDSHEFILEFGTVANNYYRKCINIYIPARTLLTHLAACGIVSVGSPLREDRGMYAHK
jgi:hypothetical protein